MDAPPVQYATTSDGVRIAWAEAGQGPALLYCGGTPFTHVQELFAVFEAYYGALARSFRLIIFDARGTGMSERDVAEVSTATLLMDAEAVIDAAKLDRFIVLADMGLLALSTALQLATVLPERVTHLALHSPFQNMRELADTPYGRVGLALAEADWAVYAQTVFRVLAGLDAADSPWLDPLAKAAAGWADPSVGLQYVRLWEATDVGHLLAGVRQPTLVLRPEPNFVPVRCCQRIAATIPGAQFRQYAEPNYEQWAELIRAFVGVSSPEPAADAPSAQSGLRTVLFTDLVGHTEMMQRLGDAKGRDVLREHERITREVLKAHSGTEVKTMGDGFMASFGSVTKAVECAVALQRAFAEREGEPLSVRVGLNAGEPIEEDGDLFGATVILASRIAAKAEGGEILVADTVRGLCSGKGFLFADRGEFVAKGFEEPVRVYEVSWRE
ncbi:MAG TPA: adenylate/guanylate cyclase domain-containing protein [Dehalococcoidia bacterium]